MKLVNSRVWESEMKKLRPGSRKTVHYQSEPNLSGSASDDDYGFLQPPKIPPPPVPPLPYTQHMLQEQAKQKYWKNIQNQLYEFYNQHQNTSSRMLNYRVPPETANNNPSMVTKAAVKENLNQQNFAIRSSQTGKLSPPSQTVGVQSSCGSDRNWITCLDSVSSSSDCSDLDQVFVVEEEDSSSEEECQKKLKELCVKCLIRHFNNQPTFCQHASMSRLPSKDNTPSLNLRESGPISSSSGTSGCDKKKPFSRPFSKTRLDPSGSSTRMHSPTPNESGALLRQNQELRHRLQEESSNYRRRLDTYKQAQSNQAALVSRLQAKVLQYKQRCSELEVQMNDVPICPKYGDMVSKPLSSSQAGTSTPLPSVCSKGGYGSSAPLSLPCPSALDSTNMPKRHYSDESGGDESFERKRVDEERKFCDQLIAQNNLLRQQLTESHHTNESLTNDLQKLTNDWESLRDEMLSKEDEWKDEEQAFNEYYNNEHSRLLKMWKEVVGVKRMFKEMATVTKMDLGKMRCEIAGTNREVVGACSGVSVNIRNATKNDEAQHFQFERENNDLKSQIQSLKHQYDDSKSEIHQRDQKLQQLMQDLRTLEERCLQSENQFAQSARLNDEIERLNSALRDIAHAVVQDADSSEVETTQHMHLSQGPAGSMPRSPKRGTLRTSQAFAESTISAVQAALHKYQLAIHDLQVKLQTNGDSLQMTKKQLDSAEGTRDVLAGKLTELTEKMDTTNYQLSELMKERDSLQKSLDSIRTDKHSVERGKAELNSIVDSLNMDYEKMQHMNSRMQKAIDSLEEEKKTLHIDLQRVSKDKDIQEMNLRAEEERTSRLREETITLREELNKLFLSRDLLEQQRVESDGFLSLLEKQKMDLEYEVDKLNSERNELSTHLEKKCSSGDNLEQEIKDLKSNIEQLEEEKNKLYAQVTEQSGDIGSLKKELISAEQLRLDLDSEKLSLSEKIKMVELEKEKVEQDLGAITRERSDLSNQLTLITRKKEAMNEEVMRMRQRFEQANEMNSRLNRNLEELVKDGEEKQIIIEAQEKELQRLSELGACMRSEKESLEAVLFDTNTTLESTDIKKDQLEHEIQDLLVKQETLRNHLARLNKDLENCERRSQEMKLTLTNTISNQEADFLQKINTLKVLGEDSIKKLQEEKEQIRLALEKRMQQALQALEANKDSEIQMLKEQFDGLQMHLEATGQQHEEVLIRAENDKQQSLMLAHRDKQAVVEKLDSVARDLKNEAELCERLKREMASKAEKERNAINSLREEITKLKGRIDEHRIRAEEDHNKAELQIASIREERDNASREVEELKVQIRLTEDKAESFNGQLQETTRKMRESDTVGELQRKDLTDTRRGLADSNIERDKYASSNKELREHIKRVEVQRREQARCIEDALLKIATIEETRNTLENDKVRLQTLLKETENGVAKLQQELTSSQSNIQKLQSSSTQKDVLEKEMQARLSNEIEEKERMQQEMHAMKKQMADLDGNLHATRQELGRARCKSNQDDHRFHGREQELAVRIEDGRNREKRLEDQKHNLEVCLADATQQIQELKARLGGAEGRVRALDDQLIHSEGCKKDVEIKLSSIGHTLRRIAGVQLDGSVSLPSCRMLSPSRRYSPARCSQGQHPDFHDSRSLSGDGPMIEVDPEMVRKGVRTLMHQVAQIERERDDYKAQLCSAKKQIHEAADLQTRGENKICKMQQHLRQVQEEKTNLDAKLKQRTSALAATEENLKQKTDELNSLREKSTSLELNLGSTLEEKAQCEERLEKTRQAVARLETEKRHLQDELNRSEGRSSKLDLQRVALEGDIQRLQMALHEKEGALRNVQDRFEMASRSSSQLEDRCVALKTTVDQLKDRLQAAAITETELKAEVNGLHKEKADQGHHVAIGQDKVKQVQKSLTNSENERRVMSERLEQCQSQMNELRRTQQTSQDGVLRLQEQLAEMEVQKSALESQLRIAKWNQDNPGQQSTAAEDQNDYGRREKADMRSKIDSLNEKVRMLEQEKRYGGSSGGGVGGGNNSKFSGHVKFDLSEKSQYDQGGEFDSNRMESEGRWSCGLDHSQIENENRDLRMKVRRLETQLAEKEAELARAKAKYSETQKCLPNDSERYRTAQLQAERLLDAREQSHRQQVLRLENQISMLREQLAQEAKRRQLYILRSSRAGREMQQLRQTLGDSLRNVAAEPIDPILLENETRRLDSAVAMSLPPSASHCYDRSRLDRSLSPTMR